MLFLMRTVKFSAAARRAGLRTGSTEHEGRKSGEGREGRRRRREVRGGEVMGGEVEKGEVDGGKVRGTYAR